MSDRYHWLLSALLGPKFENLFFTFEHILLYGFLSKIREEKDYRNLNSMEVMHYTIDLAGKDRAIFNMFKKEPDNS